MAEKLVVVQDGGDVWLSDREGQATKLDMHTASKILQASTIIGHKTKALLKDLLRAGSSALPVIGHDVEQGAFLLNPLQKSRTLADLVGLDSIDDPKLAVAALWSVYAGQLEKFSQLPDLYHVAATMDFPLIPVLARMEFYGMKLDSNKLVEMNKELVAEVSDIKKEIYQMVGYEFNIASPVQLADALFNKLLLPTAGIKKGKTGYSTGQKELDKLRGQHPIIELVERFRELTKLQNTYVATLPEQTDERGYIHTTLNQDVTATGRLSSTDPNLQNIPIRTELGRKIREAFVPADGNVFVNADYSQFELRLAAIMSGESSMVESFNTDIDVHAKTASEVYGIPISEVTKDQRRRAKVVNFGILYGMSQHGLAQAANMSFAEAQHFIDEYYRIRPNVKKFMEETIRRAREDGYVQTLFGRRRPTPDVKSSNYIVRSSAERAAANMPIQGTEADLVKLAMIEVDKHLDDDCHQVIQIHDSIMIECPQEKAQKVGDILVEVMENIYPKLGVKLRVDVKIGKNWGEV